MNNLSNPRIPNCVMAKKKYIVCLTSVEREVLEKLTTTGKAPAYKVNHARILLKADTNRVDGGWTDESISIALDISVATIERVRQRFVIPHFNPDRLLELFHKTLQASPRFYMPNQYSIFRRSPNSTHLFLYFNRIEIKPIYY